MKKNSFIIKIAFFLEKYFAALLLYILGFTYRYRELGNFPKERVVFSFWHRNQIPLLYFKRNKGITILISSSKDGELIAGPARVMGFNTARGSSRRGGLSAVKELIRKAADYSLAISPDGPKGPNMQVKEGALFVAYVTKLPVVPVGVHIEKEWIFKSWDRFRFPKPFSRINVIFDEPFFIDNKDEINSKLDYFQQAMNQAQVKVENF
ncbi:MAG: lysophospholipid acyltransferase family protein [Candidatus Cloacimonetes bacterium]|nr:lysophospholipid acyltransferase family protein [Candidatus Cloacimonadota bacterium]